MVRAGLAVAAVVSCAPLGARAGDLALKRVMLSSAGIGYFEYDAEVDGAASLGLDVPLDQVDDVLKSLVVFDDAGSVGGLELAGRDASHAAFGDVPFGPEALNAPLDFLNSLQGVEILVQGPRPMTGRLLHADTVTEPVAASSGAPPGGAQRSVERTRVSVMTADGLRQFVLEDADSVQVADAGLRERVARAIAALRHESGQDARHLTIRLSGRAAGLGPRTVRVGYVAAAPLWKASYRVVLPDGTPPAAESRARIQGWATLENASGADWSSVSLSLQYGNPVTFRQSIYRSYFVTRPEVPVEVLGRLLPDVDTAARPEPQASVAPGDGAPARAKSFAAPPLPPAPARAAAPLAMAAAEQPVQAAEGGEETVFTVPVPVTLAAGHSASVPILDRDVPAARIGLGVAEQAHPLASVRIRNTSDSSLPAGVLTLYDQAGPATYAGDARLGGLPAGASRLLSFAEDLRTSLEWHRASAVSIAALTASSGVLRIDERERQTTRVVMTAPPTQPRHLLMEVAKGIGQSLATDGPRADEETATAWRFAIDLAAGETQTLSVSADRMRRQATTLLTDSAIIARVLNEAGLGDAARVALGHIADLRAQEAARAGERDAVRAQLDAVEKDETRLRDNLRAVTAGDALRSRLVRDLDADETRIAQLRQSLDQAAQAVERARQALADAVNTLRL